jgi:hypothetical protein
MNRITKVAMDSHLELFGYYMNSQDRIENDEITKPIWPQMESTYVAQGYKIKIFIGQKRT